MYIAIGILLALVVISIVFLAYVNRNGGGPINAGLKDRPTRYNE